MKNEEKILKIAKKRFEACNEADREAKNAWKEDHKFANGDSINMHQWTSSAQSERKGRPCLTINKVKKHNRQIINEAKQNKASIKVYPVDDKADKKTAEMFSGLIRHIESISNADIAYDTALEHVVDAGLGYWRITTDYIDDSSFDQEIYIEPIYNPLMVTEGPKKIKRGLLVSDFVFISEDVNKETFESKCPGYKFEDMKETDNFADITDSSWITEDTIRLCEYYTTEVSHDTLIMDGEGNTIYLSEIPKEERESIKAMEGIKQRKVSKEKIKWYFIAGDKIIDHKDWAGSYIPVVRMIGTETIIDGKTDRKGHTRQMRDSQLMYNYYASVATEYTAMQGKQPYLAAVSAIQGYEKHWSVMNVNNASYLPWNNVDANGNQVPKPERQAPPEMAQAYIEGMQLASQDMISTSGQENAQFGKTQSGQSGVALNALQSKSETSTFHFSDNKQHAMKFTGTILIDLIPKIYDTKRVARILGEDGVENKAEIDPDQQESVVEMQDEEGGVKTIYNPSVGTYDVIVSSGANYGTKRREGAQLMSELAGQNPQIMQVAGDLIMKMFDVPYSEEVAERIKRSIPPQLLGDEEKGQGKEQMQQQMQKTQQELEQYKKMIESLDDVVQKMSSEIESKEIERYKAETDRLKVEKENMSPEQIQALVVQLLNDLAAPDSKPIQPMEQQQQPLENTMEQPQQFAQ